MQSYGSISLTGPPVSATAITMSSTKESIAKSCGGLRRWIMVAGESGRGGKGERGRGRGWWFSLSVVALLYSIVEVIMFSPPPSLLAPKDP